MLSETSSADVKTAAPVTEPKKDSPLQNLFYTLFALAAGIALLVWQYQDGKAAQATLAWPTAEGQITASSIEQSQVFRKKALRDVYRPNIEYEYQVDGQKLTGTRIDVGDSYSTEDPTRGDENLALFPVGKKVTVSYDPNDHAVTVIEPGMSTSSKRLSWLLYGLGGFLTLCGVVGVPSCIYELMKKKPV